MVPPGPGLGFTGSFLEEVAFVLWAKLCPPLEDRPAWLQVVLPAFEARAPTSPLLEPGNLYSYQAPK